LLNARGSKDEGVGSPAGEAARRPSVLPKKVLLAKRTGRRRAAAPAAPYGMRDVILARRSNPPPPHGNR